MASELAPLSVDGSNGSISNGPTDRLLSPNGASSSLRHSHQSVAFDKAVDEILRLGDQDLAIEGDSLIVIDRAARKNKKRGCGFGASASVASPRRSIPLYNVLWAALAPDGQSVTIELAEAASKTRIRTAQLCLTVCASDDAPTPAEIENWIETLLGRAYGPAKRRKRAYVLVNPNAGPGGVVKKWETQVRPVFEAAQMELTVVTTEYGGQAMELCAALDVDKYDLVVPCAGDGMPHEVFNGLAKRPDARRALRRLAVAHIPCGSGNAMACNLYGTHRPSLAALAIVKGVETPLDLVSITQGDRRLISFLSQAVGIVADVDLGTEHLRWMGEARFTWGFLERLLSKKIYPCDLAVKVEIEHKHGVKMHYSRSQTNASSGSSAASDSEEGSGAAAAGDAKAKVEEAGDVDGPMPPLRYGTVNDALPEGWELIPHDKMGNFYCGNMAYMAPDAQFFSAALINDGLMDLVTIDGDISAVKSLGLMLSVEDGRFFDNPLVVYRKVSGYRIIPKDQKDGYISIDGERVPFEPFQAEIHQGLGTVISKRGGYEAPGPRDWDKVSATERFMA